MTATAKERKAIPVSEITPRCSLNTLHIMLYVVCEVNVRIMKSSGQLMTSGVVSWVG